MTSPNEETIQRLALIKQLYLFAYHQSYPPSTAMNKILGVIGFDLAIENAMRVAISHLDPSVRVDQQKNFPNLLKQAKELLAAQGKGNLPLEGRVPYFHRIRNDAQHNARTPSEPDVSEFQLVSREFLSGLFELVWDLDFDAVSLLWLVKSPISRKYLEAAEKHLIEDDFDKSIENSNAAISYALSDASKLMFPRSRLRLYKGLGLVKWNIGGVSRPTPKIDPVIEKKMDAIEEELDMKSSKLTHELNSLRKEVKSELDAIEEPLLFSMLNLSYSEYIEFQSTAGAVRFFGKEHEFEVKGAKAGMKKEDAEFAFSYSVNSIAQIEGAVYGARVASLRKSGQID